MKIYLRRCHALTVADGAFSQKVDYGTGDSKSPRASKLDYWFKVTAILLNGWILPMGGASSGRVRACSLRSRRVFFCILIKTLGGRVGAGKESKNA